MPDALTFGLLVLTAAAAGLLAVQSQSVTQKIRIPAPVLFLVAAAFAARFVPAIEQPDHRTVERVVTLALLVILFDGGISIGARRLLEARSGVVSLGVLGTFATVIGAALLTHLLLDIGWFLSVLVATAIAPTDPAVVFSVLGQREVQGRSGSVLEGESGANDPVGIALMGALLSAGSLSGGAAVHVAGTFFLQMVVGGTVGVVGGRLLVLVMRRVPLPGEGLHPVRALVVAGVLFGLATVAHGSGFLAVFLAGVVIGDERAPYKREIERFQSALAGVAEVVAFVYLGFTIDLGVLARSDVWLPGLVLGVLLAALMRPLLCYPLLRPSRLTNGETAFVLFAGLKGAVSLLLGTLLLPLAGGDRLFGVVVVVVLVSVLLQGTLVPTLARLLRVAMRDLEPEPFVSGMRLRKAPVGERHVTVVAGSAAAHQQIDSLPGLAEGTWVSMVRRSGALVPVRGTTRMLPGDDVLLLIDPEQDAAAVLELFTGPGQPG